MEPAASTSAPTTATASIATDHASRYLQQLCKHFAHKIPVTFDPQHGAISFGAGECRLEADPQNLRLFVTAASADQLGSLQDVVARHLVRFAFREELVIDWL